jgi:hypothetical protein
MIVRTFRIDSFALPKEQGWLHDSKTKDCRLRPILRENPIETIRLSGTARQTLLPLKILLMEQIRQ